MELLDDPVAWAFAAAFLLTSHAVAYLVGYSRGFRRAGDMALDIVSKRGSRGSR